MSTWIGRNLLEYQSALSGSFWTLTYEEIPSIDNAKRHLRNFLRALRHSESRSGNRAPIRYYGCLEFGGQFGRPHFHLLLYNVVRNYREPTPYLRGLPRPRYHIGLWPHGHVDIGELNSKTIWYVSSYMQKTAGSGSESALPFRTVRPAIGHYGLSRLARALVSKRGSDLLEPDFLNLNGRRYPMDRWMKMTFRNECLRYGGSLLKEQPLERWHRLRLKAELTAPVEMEKERAWARLRFRDRAAAARQAQKEAQEQQYSDVYIRYEASRGSDRKEASGEALGSTGTD